MLLDSVDDEVCRGLSDRFVRREVFRPEELVIDAAVRRRSLASDCDGDIGSACAIQQLARDLRPRRCVGIGDRYAERLEVWM